MAADDEFIHADVHYLLSCNLSLPRQSVTVYVKSGWVTLLGYVDWPFQKAAAEWGILKHSGATGIVNQITVRQSRDVDTSWIGQFQCRSRTALNHRW